MPTRPELPPPIDCRLDPKEADVPALAVELTRRVYEAGGQALVVGGLVRDRYYDRKGGDVDLEVFGLTVEELEQIALQLAPVKRVGRTFGILKVGALDVSLPRRERIPGPSGLEKVDPQHSFVEASRRRDFTVNSMAYEPLGGEIFDPWGGYQDLKAGRLRHVDADTFGEDPLRALRAIRFVACYPLELDPETAGLCRQLVPALPELPRERILGEFRRLLLKGERIGAALELARRLGIVRALWPELEALHGCPQDPRWHPEGNVWRHTMLAIDQAARLRVGDEYEDFALMAAVLLHDVGKPKTTVHREDGSIKSHKHDLLGAPMAARFLERLTVEKSLVALVATLVREHGMPLSLFKQGAGDIAVRRLSARVRLELLERVARADFLGRTTPKALSGEFIAGDWMTRIALGTGVWKRSPEPIMRGRDLLSLGVKEGPLMGKMLARLFDAQLNGTITDLESGYSYARSLIASGISSSEES